MLRKLLAVAALALVTAPALAPATAQRGDGDHDRQDRRGDDDRGWDRDWGDGHRDRDHDRGRRDRGGSWGGGWDLDWDRGYSDWGGGWGYDRHHYRDDDWWVGLYAGSALFDMLTPEPRYYSGDAYGYGGYSSYPAQAPNAWGLFPNQCRWDREFGYWYNRPADVEVQRCADGYGTVYVVQGSHRLLRYR